MVNQPLSISVVGGHPGFTLRICTLANGLSAHSSEISVGKFVGTTAYQPLGYFWVPDFQRNPNL